MAGKTSRTVAPPADFQESRLPPSDPPEPRSEPALPPVSAGDLLSTALVVLSDTMLSGLQSLANALDHLGTEWMKAATLDQQPYELEWRPFQGRQGDEVVIRIQAPTALKLAERMQEAITVLGPVLREKFHYEWRNTAALPPVPPGAPRPGPTPPQPAPPPPPSAPAPGPTPPPPPAGEQRRRGPTGSRGSGKPSAGATSDSGDFVVKRIAVVFVDKADRNKLVVEGEDGEKIWDGIPGGAPAWAKYFPKDERDEWKDVLLTEGVVYDSAEDSEPLICFWTKKGQYQNIDRFEWGG